ncbi:MAG: hypothetical protein LBE98_04225 [Puniceicoccales bacterium]|jgi:tyrosine-specific transport protein|nr:hypothetical protein [Puniceicoccales bacterium]
MCNNNIKLLKTACLWGSIIPAIVYVIWMCSVICLLSAKFPESFAALVSKNMEVSELINLLAVACNWGFVRTLLLAISATAIATSIFGVSLCLKDDFYTFFSKILDRKASVVASCLCMVVPGCFVAIFIPNAFIHVLSFAGMLLVVIAIFIPILLLGKVRQSFKL